MSNTVVQLKDIIFPKKRTPAEIIATAKNPDLAPVAPPTQVETPELVRKLAQTPYTDTPFVKEILGGVKSPPVHTIPGIFGLPNYQITGTSEKKAPDNDDITISRALLSKMLQDSIALPPPTQATPVPGVKKSL